MSWLKGWDKRVSISIPSFTSFQTDLNFKINVSFKDGMKDDFSDLRFVDSDGSLLEQYIEEYTSGISSVWWIKVPECPVDGKIIYLYYGNDTAILKSDGEKVFLFFDDFTGDLSKWDTSGNVYIDSDNLILEMDMGADCEILSKATNFGSSIGLATRVKDALGNDNEPRRYIGFYDGFQFQDHYFKGLGTTKWKGTENSDASDIGYNTWHKIEIRKYDNIGTKYYFDNILEATHSNSGQDDYVGFNLYTAYQPDDTLTVDYVFVFKLPDDAVIDDIIPSDTVEISPYKNKKCYVLEQYIYELLHQINERINVFAPQQRMAKIVHKDICSTIMQVGGYLNQYYRKYATVALNTTQGKVCEDINHTNSTEVSGFSGLTENAWQDGSIILVKDDVYYFARVVSNTSTTVTIPSSTDLPEFTNEIVILIIGNGIYADISGLDMMDYDEPIWEVVDGNGKVIERLPDEYLKFKDNISNIPSFDNNVYWYQDGQKLIFVFGNKAKLSGHIKIGYYRLPREAKEMTDCVDLPIEFHNIAQEKTIKRLLIQKSLSKVKDV